MPSVTSKPLMLRQIKICSKAISILNFGGKIKFCQSARSLQFSAQLLQLPSIIFYFKKLSLPLLLCLMLNQISNLEASHVNIMLDG
jgi:hypothetical protein